MANVVRIEEQVEIPLPMESLEQFRAWALSEDFPEQGRIDYIQGSVEVNLSPEDAFTHGTLKGEIYSALLSVVKQGDLGYLFTDSMRVSSPVGDVSSEPDIVFISHQSLDEQRVELIPKSTREAGRFVELQGAPDLIVEIVSDSSVHKDTQRLPAAWFAAGLPEYWLADARGEEMLFTIYQRGSMGFEPVEPSEDGFQRSTVLQASFRIERSRDQRNFWAYQVLSR